MVGSRVVVMMVAALAACGVEPNEREEIARALPPPTLGGPFTVTSMGQTPSTASNGTTFLLVWSDGSDIRGARISATGAMLDSISIATTSGEQCAPQVASNGIDYYVTWIDQCQTSDSNIAGARVSAQGVVDAPLAIAATSSIEDHPRIASNGTDYLVVWHQAAQNIDDVYGQLIDHAGTATGGVLALAATPGVTEIEPAVGSLGGNYLVTWSDFRSYTQFDIYAHRVSAAGVISDGGGFVVSNASASQSVSAISANGSSYMVIWEDSRTSADMIDLYAAAVSADATVSSEIAISQAVGHQLEPAIASNGYDYFTAWEDDRSTQDIYGTPIAGSSVTANGFAITNSMMAERHTTIGYNAAANGYLLAYQVSDVSATWSSPSTPIAIAARLITQCGDNTIQAGEQCDDGNLADGDGCSSTCTLEAGFACSGSPSSCADIDECLTNNGGCSQDCANTAGSYHCECNPGYSLAGDNTSCTDIDECATANGNCAQTCTNAIGSFTCSCSAGFMLAADHLACDDVNECDSNRGGCAQHCVNTTGSFNCTCDAGFTLDADAIGCTDIDECATANGGCSDVCTNTAGAFACSCSPTEGLADDGHTCITCPAGTIGNGTTCADIDECAAGTATCTANQTCTNTTGSFECTDNDSGGGCSTTGGHNGVLLAIGLALAIRRRARRQAA